MFWHRQTPQAEDKRVYGRQMKPLLNAKQAFVPIVDGCPHRHKHRHSDFFQSSLPLNKKSQIGFLDATPNKSRLMKVTYSTYQQISSKISSSVKKTERPNGETFKTFRQGHNAVDASEGHIRQIQQYCCITRLATKGSERNVFVNVTNLKGQTIVKFAARMGSTLRPRIQPKRSVIR
jgi:hypothetical protein